MYSLARSEENFRHCVHRKNWIRNIEEHASADVEKMILGNKCDMNDKRQVTRNVFYTLFALLGTCLLFSFQVSKDRGEQLAIEYGIKFMETSAKASINVEEAFFTLARDIKAKTEKKLVGLSSVYSFL